MAKTVFVTNYHVSVNDGLVNDLQAIGLEVVMPDGNSFGDRIKFFASNEEHRYKGVRTVGYEEFLAIPQNMAVIINCFQLYDDMMQLYKDRGERDTIIHLPSQMGIQAVFKNHPANYVMSHDLDFHRNSKASYKILYFNRPKITRPTKNQQEIEASYRNKQIKLYINHFGKVLNGALGEMTFEEEYRLADELRKAWLERTGWRIPFYGYDSEDGRLSMEEVQQHMSESMFTLVFKSHETWGQMINESMLLGTPCVFLERFVVNMFTEYLITKDTAIIGKSIDDILHQLDSLTLPQYETLVNEARSQSNMFCNDELRQDKLEWLFSKIPL